jgi:hypothetical protein
VPERTRFAHSQADEARSRRARPSEAPEPDTSGPFSSSTHQGAGLRLSQACTRNSTSGTATGRGWHLGRTLHRSGARSTPLSELSAWGGAGEGPCRPGSPRAHGARPKKPGAAPGHLHHPLGGRARSERSRNASITAPSSNGPRRGWTTRRSRPAVAHLVLDQLIIGRPAADPRRKPLLERADNAGVEERHPLGRRLLDARDRVEVSPVAEAVERTATFPLLDDGLVSHRDVEHHERREGVQRGEQERLGGKAVAGPRAGRSVDEGVKVVEQVDVVGGLRF